MSRAVQIVSTESDAGKTQIVAALMYIFRDLNPFPFKGQNMSLNSYVGLDDGEMAFAQAYQSMVVGERPVTLSNPVLLKPVGRNRTEVIFLGKSLGIFDSKHYWLEFKDELKERVFSVFEKVSSGKRFVFVEGAGSCSEINLRSNDFSNLNLSTRFDIPFVLVSDIERGGVFAKVVGSYELMSARERDLLLGVIINKMSGDRDLLKEGIDYIERRIGRRVMGVIPYDSDILLPEEDSVGLMRPRKRHAKRGECGRRLSIKVIHLRYISNFFDFYPLELDSKYNEGIDFSYAGTPEELDGADVVVLPGSRNVFHDLVFLRDSGFARKIHELLRKGRLLIGICGGYEMLFEKIQDEFGIEFPEGEVSLDGLGLIKGSVLFQRQKKVCWESIYIESPWFSGRIRGFNIRHGSHELDFFSGENIFGTFLHNIFWNDGFRESFYKYFGVDYKKSFKDSFKEEIESWSLLVKNNVDLSFMDMLV